MSARFRTATSDAMTGVFEVEGKTWREVAWFHDGERARRYAEAENGAPAAAPVETAPAAGLAAERVLEAARRLGPRCSNMEIARAAGIATPAAVSAYLGQLEAEGKVRRVGKRRGRLLYVIDGNPMLPAPQEAAARPKRRFQDHRPPTPERVTPLADDHPAVIEGRTLFPSTVVKVEDSPRLLVSGQNSRKIGDRVVKGAWSGFPVFTLTLEERATCPRSCHHWSTCYGNAMPQARRHEHGPELIERLWAEVASLQERHPGGFVVRLHVLGDFWHVDYLRFWGQMLDAFPALHAFGYTAWPRGSEIGAAIKGLTDRHWDRFAIRFSEAEARPQGAVTIWTVPEGPTVPEGIVCPAMTGASDCCGTCGLCWAPAARGKTIVFIAHGMSRGARASAA